MRWFVKHGKGTRPKQEMKKMTTIIENDTQTDAITGGFTIGTPAVVAKALSEMKNTQHALVNDMGDSVTATDVDLTLTDNNSGATMNITADKVTTGIDTERPTWASVSAPKALKIALHFAGFMAPNIQNSIIDCLQAVADGADWETALEEALGHRLTAEQHERVDAMIDSTRREVVKPSKGRMQATGVSTN